MWMLIKYDIIAIHVGLYPTCTIEYLIIIILIINKLDLFPTCATVLQNKKKNKRNK